MHDLIRRYKLPLFVVLLGLLAALPLLSGDLRAGRLALNTWLLAGAVVAASVPLGTLLALLLTRTDLPGRGLFYSLLLGLLFVPLYVQVGAWQAGFGLQGWYTFAYSGPALLDGWRGAIWVHAVAALPWVVLIVSSGLRFVERDLEEQALLDAASGLVIRQVTLRRALGAIGAAVLWVAVTASAEMTVTDFFQVRTYAEEIYIDIALGGDPGSAPWAGVAGASSPQSAANETTALPAFLPGAMICAWLVVAGGLLVSQLLPAARFASQGQTLEFPLGPWRFPAALFVGASVVLFVALPVGSLAFKAGVVVDQIGAERIRHWSLDKCLAIVASSPVRYGREFGWSLAIAALAATAAVSIAFPLAWFARRGGWRAFPALALAAFGFSLPGPIVGLATIGLLNRPEIPLLSHLYDHSILAPWLAQTWRALPLALLVLWPALRGLPREVLESAAVAGAGLSATLVHIVLPLRSGAILGGWLAAFAVALAELDATVLVVPPGVETLTIHVFNLLHYSVEDRAAGICLTLYLLFHFGAILGRRLAFRR